LLLLQRIFALKLTLATAASFVFTQKNTPGVYLCKSVAEWEAAGGKWHRLLSDYEVERAHLPSKVMPLTNKPTDTTMVCNACGTSINHDGTYNSGDLRPSAFKNLEAHLATPKHKKAMAAAKSKPEFEAAPIAGNACWSSYVR
jgi:hypothetical protein